MTTFSERLASLSLPCVLAIIAVLSILRYALGKQKSATARATAEMFESLLIAVALVFLVIKPFIVETFYIPSESMVPTLQKYDRLLVNKMVYRFTTPRRGDIVVFKAPYSATEGKDLNFIKRLIGLPGDVLQIKVQGFDPFYKAQYGSLYVNGKAVNEPYLREPHHIVCASSDVDAPPICHPAIDLRHPYKVPADTYFMMGDNRNNSDDSRFWGPLDKDRIIGMAKWQFWPTNRIGIIR